MWVFGFGSLMWDGWEHRFDGDRVERAVLKGYRRAFNKASVQNWGTREAPCPTLGLAATRAARCTGVAFRMAEAKRGDVWTYLRDREGPSFDLKAAPVMLPDGGTPWALVAINDPCARSHIGDSPLDERAAMVLRAEGTSGTGIDYLQNTRAHLHALSIEDPAVEALWALVQALR
jgi:cation transport protein ChaC